MYFIWLVISLLCLIYYIVCVNYAGFSAAFVFMWLVAAIVFMAIFIGFTIIKSNNIIVPSLFKILFWGVVAIGIGMFIISEGLIISKMTSTPKVECDYIIVLGAQIKGTKVTNSLRERLDTAYDYIVLHPNTKIIVSGGQGQGEDITEACAMKEYLVARGIEDSKIMMENRSINTTENMKFSVDFIEDKKASIGIVTSNFHIYRSIKLAKAQGLTNVSGIDSPCDSILFLNYMVRESVGITKDAVMGNY